MWDESGFAVHMVLPGVEALIDAVEAQLTNLGFGTRASSLATLHHHLPPELMAFNEHFTNAVSRAFYPVSDDILAAYHAFLVRGVRPLLSEDFLFQAQPLVRFHFPVPFHAAMKTTTGLPRQLHSDLLGGHPPEMMQGWLALTDCTGSAALQCASRNTSLEVLDAYREQFGPTDPPFADSLHHFYDTWDRDPHFAEAITAACAPVTMTAGDLLLFDPHCLHGGTENHEDTTRVSLDFRLLPASLEKVALDNATTDTGRRFKRGELFSEQSIWELTAS